jgi:hypothetical protein
VVVADTGNHALRGLRLSDGNVTTVAGTGMQLRERSGGGPAAAQALSTPWDVAWFDGLVVVAMAGTHQLWSFDPAERRVAVLAGTSAEGIRDGGSADAWFAQPSGLVVSADGTTLWVADSETSALRSVTRHEVDGSPYEVLTATGTGLFDFGHVDGPAATARMQHPLGVAVLPDGSVAVADTYNGAVRRFDPVSGELSTLATGLAEPSALALDSAVPMQTAAGAAAAGTTSDPVLVVVESAAHRLVRVPIPAQAQRVDGGARSTQRPTTQLAPGAVTLEVTFVPPTGQKLDDRWGDPTRLVVSATPPQLLADGDGSATGLVRELRLGDAVSDGVLHVSVQAAACDAESDELVEHAACHLYQQDWGIPIHVVAGAARELRLDLRGT